MSRLYAFDVDNGMTYVGVNNQTNPGKSIDDFLMDSHSWITLRDAAMFRTEGQIFKESSRDGRSIDPLSLEKELRLKWENIVATQNMTTTLHDSVCVSLAHIVAAYDLGVARQFSNPD
ncbi:MAG: hypothetical protein WC533_02875 [Candidatus Pacearchaeota archaeon]